MCATWCSPGPTATISARWCFPTSRPAASWPGFGADATPGRDRCGREVRAKFAELLAALAAQQPGLVDPRRAADPDGGAAVDGQRRDDRQGLDQPAQPCWRTAPRSVEQLYAEPVPEAVIRSNMTAASARSQATRRHPAGRARAAGRHRRAPRRRQHPAALAAAARALSRQADRTAGILGGGNADASVLRAARQDRRLAHHHLRAGARIRPPHRPGAAASANSPPSGRS